MVNELLQKNDVVVIYVPKNNTNVFLPLDISVNKSVKCYLSSKYQDWHGDKGIRAVEQRCWCTWFQGGYPFKYNKVSSREMDRRYVKVYERIERSAKDLKKISKSATLINLCENPFQQIKLVVDTAVGR